MSDANADFKARVERRNQRSKVEGASGGPKKVERGGFPFFTAIFALIFGFVTSVVIEATRQRTGSSIPSVDSLYSSGDLRLSSYLLGASLMLVLYQAVMVVIRPSRRRKFYTFAIAFAGGYACFKVISTISTIRELA